MRLIIEVRMAERSGSQRRGARVATAGASTISFRHDLNVPSLLPLRNAARRSRRRLLRVVVVGAICRTPCKTVKNLRRSVRGVKDTYFVWPWANRATCPEHLPRKPEIHLENCPVGKVRWPNHQ